MGEPPRRPGGPPLETRRNSTLQGHVHTGIVEVAFAGLSAILVIHLLRFLAAQMVDSKSLSGVGKALGGLVSF